MRREAHSGRILFRAYCDKHSQMQRDKLLAKGAQAEMGTRAGMPGMAQPGNKTLTVRATNKYETNNEVYVDVYMIQSHKVSQMQHDKLLAKGAQAEMGTARGQPCLMIGWLSGPRILGCTSLIVYDGCCSLRYTG